MQLAGKREQMTDALRRGSAALPSVRAWTQDLVARHAAAARPVADRAFPRLPDYFPEDLLRTTSVVTVTRVPFPPLSSEFGLSELAELEHMSFSAITFAGMIFAHTSVAAEATFFHEMVHVVQWKVLGIDDFILTSGAGLVECGYAQSPFEAFTYDLQHQFERGVTMSSLVQTITDHAIQTRAWAADLYQRLGVPIGP
jgi:hypothetical protein